MTTTITRTRLSELQSERTVVELALRKAQRHLSKDGRAKDDVRARREELQLIDDQIEGLRDSERIARAAAEKAERRADKEARASALQAVTEDLEAGAKVAVAVRGHAHALGASFAEFLELRSRILRRLEPFIRGRDFAALKDELFPSDFYPDASLVAGELAAAGFCLSGMDPRLAASSVGQRGFVEWVALRNDRVIAMAIPVLNADEEGK